MLKCIAVDDEKLVLDLLVDNIRQVPFLQLVKRCRYAMEAAEALHENEVDLIFLDVQMPGLNGLQFLQSLSKPPMAILITAYPDYALEGYSLDVVDYLLKPVSFERFLKACNKAYELYRLRQKPTPSEELPDYFFVFVEYVQVKVTIPAILYVEGMKDYVKIHLENNTRPVITKMSMKALLDRLQGWRFVRTHKSYIVNADRVTAVRRDLICLGSLELPLSESCRPAVEQLLSL